VSDGSDGLREELQRVTSPRYQVGEEIGRGGMAIVFRGVDTVDGRAVAFKVLKRQHALILGPSRFLREIRLLAQLHHPSILPLLDSGQSGTLFYFVMPLVEGETLQARLEREPQLPLEVVQRVITQVAAALDHAHDAGIVHRDVKPSNLFLSGGQTLVADFGIAKDLTPTDEDSTTSTGVVIGTAQYMSPEQAAGSVRPDRRADVYSLGCVAYQMLVGEPPFNGPSVQAVIARHRSVPPPAVRLLRPELPTGIEVVIRKALAKSPADRYQSAGEFARALSDPAQLSAAEQPDRPRRWLRLLLIGSTLVGLAFLPRGVTRLFEPPLDPNKVVVFPLVEQGTGIRAGTGQEIALMIGSALENTAPLKWIDGWTWLSPAQRANASVLGESDASSIARRRSARYYVDGAVMAGTDSTRVILRLNDARGDTVVSQATAAGLADSTTFPQLGLRAVNGLLVRLLEPGRSIDLTALAERRPAAIADWLQGEREYRRSRYSLALEYERKAVETDSALAFAALKGAMAAEWEHHYDEAAGLVDLALRNDSILPPKYVHFAEGLRDYYAGHADSATEHLQQALQLDPAWNEAWMMLGEVRYHLFTGAESLAAEAFTRARAPDPAFAPPLFHLAQIALRRDDTTSAANLIRQFGESDPDSLWLEELTLTLNCLRLGPSGVDWGAAAVHDPLGAIQVAKLLASPDARPACATAGFDAVLALKNTPDTVRWGAILGLHGILAARGRNQEVKPLLDGAVVSGLMAAKGLYVIDAVAGLGMDAQAENVIAELGGDYQKMGAARLWYHGIWLAHRGDQANLGQVSRALSRIAEVSGDQFDISSAKSVAARLALLEADTGRAIVLLGGVVPAGDAPHIEWGMQEPFGQEQLLLAQLLLARGQASEAIRVADRLDGPRPIIYLVYLRQSLELRIRAAEWLGRADLAAEYKMRLAKLS